MRDPGVTGAVLVGAFLAIGRDTDHDKVWLERAERFKAQAPAIQRARAEIFGDDVRLRHQFAGDVRALRGAQIQRDGSLVARFAQPVETRSSARAQAERAQRIPASGHLDLDHLCAELPEDRSAIGGGDHRRQVEHPKSFQRSFAFVHGKASLWITLLLPARLAAMGHRRTCSVILSACPRGANRGRGSVTGSIRMLPSPVDLNAAILYQSCTIAPRREPALVRIGQGRACPIRG